MTTLRRQRSASFTTATALVSLAPLFQYYHSSWHYVSIHSNVSSIRLFVSVILCGEYYYDQLPSLETKKQFVFSDFIFSGNILFIK